MTQKILCLYDLSDNSRLALDQALDLAALKKASLHVLHVLSMDARLVAYGMNPPAEEIRQQIEKELQSHLSSHPGTKTISPSVEVQVGDTLEVILETIKNLDPALVVVGTHGRTGLKHFFLGSVAEKVARLSPSPVMIVRKKISLPPQRLMIPIDFSDFSEEAFEKAANFCSKKGMALDLVHVLALADAFATSPQGPDYREADLLALMEKTAQEQIQKVADRHPEFTIKTHILIGSPTDAICQKAKELQTDLLVIPTHGRSGLTHLFLGSVAEMVLRYAPCTVYSFSPDKLKEVKKASLP